MNALLVTASVAPLLAEASLRSEQVSQLVLGEGARVREEQGDMLQVETMLDGDEGWIARGYTLEVPLAEAEAWLADAGWSEGAVLATRAGMVLRAPHRARLRVDDDGTVQLPSGERSDVYSGSVRSWIDVIADSRAQSPAAWAWSQFGGTPYLWGGVTGAGMDCSGLTQTTFLARGAVLPRDAHQQAALGALIDPAARQPGDLLFFRSRDSDHIGHVGMLDDGDMLVHSTVDTGGVTRESLAPGARAHGLMARLVAVRRIA